MSVRSDGDGLPPKDFVERNDSARLEMLESNGLQVERLEMGDSRRELQRRALWGTLWMLKASI